MKNPPNRRQFLKTTALAAGAVAFGFPALVRGKNLNSKLNIAIHRRRAAKGRATRIIAAAKTSSPCATWTRANCAEPA